MTTSTEKNPDAATLCFNSHEDAIDFANKSFQDTVRWQAVNDVDFAKRYERGGLHVAIDIEVGSFADPSKCHLIFVAVPGRIHNSLHGTAAQNSEIPKLEFIGDDCHRAKDSMFVGISQLVQGPQGVIPSLVWLERFHDRKDVWRDFFGTTRRSVFYFCGSIAKRGGLRHI